MEEIIEFDGMMAGHTISNVAEKALELACTNSKLVHFVFNDTHVTVRPGEAVDTVVERWQKDYTDAAEAYRNSDEHKQAILQRAEEERLAREVVMVIPELTEQEMRDAEVPWPKTEKQLVEYVGSLVSRQHTYGTCVYAMSMAATAAFHYAAGLLGCTGFQAGMADLDFVRRTRHIDGPFMLVTGDKALYPQYDLEETLREALKSWRPWLREQAQEKLRTTTEAHPDVIAHWQALAEPERTGESL